MSITTAPATVTGITATSATDEPFTVTAEIATDMLGTAYLRVVVDGVNHCFTINPHFVRLRDLSVQGVAARLLQKHAGYTTTGAWTEGENGRLTAPVAEIAGRCRTCVHGCGHGVGDTGCGHWQCLAATPEIANTCDGAALALSAKRTYRDESKRAVTRRPAAPKTAKRNRRGDWWADPKAARR